MIVNINVQTNLTTISDFFVGFNSSVNFDSLKSLLSVMFWADILTVPLNGFVSGAVSKPFEFPGSEFGLGFRNAGRSHVHTSLGIRPAAFLQPRREPSSVSWLRQRQKIEERWNDCQEIREINPCQTTWSKAAYGKSLRNSRRFIRKEKFPESDFWTKLNKRDMSEYNAK
jgi:hypothetical protein